MMASNTGDELITVHDAEPDIGGRWMIIEVGGVFLAGQFNHDDRQVFQFRCLPAAAFTTYQDAYNHCVFMHNSLGWLQAQKDGDE